MDPLGYGLGHGSNVGKTVAQNCLAVQHNGQRIYGPPPNWTGAAPRGCEVFIGKLPRDMLENEIIPVFAQCGQIYQFRLMMDFSGTNRGFGFVTYATKAAANMTCEVLNGYEIRPRRNIYVVKSIDNKRLFIGKVPRNKTLEEVKEEIEKLTEGVTNVIMYPHRSDRTKNRGFAFVEYESHKAATIARRKLIPARCSLWGTGVAVDWAEPEIEPDEDVMSQVKILYVRNIMLHTSEMSLRQAFESSAGYGTVERVKKITDYGFVHFYKREHALLARDKMNGACLDGAVLEVTLARPPGEITPEPNSTKTFDIPTVEETRRVKSNVSFYGESSSRISAIPPNFYQNFDLSINRQNTNVPNPYAAILQSQGYRLLVIK